MTWRFNLVVEWTIIEQKEKIINRLKLHIYPHILFSWETPYKGWELYEGAKWKLQAMRLQYIPFQILLECWVAQNTPWHGTTETTVRVRTWAKGFIIQFIFPSQNNGSRQDVIGRNNLLGSKSGKCILFWKMHLLRSIKERKSLSWMGTVHLLKGYRNLCNVISFFLLMIVVGWETLKISRNGFKDKTKPKLKINYASMHGHY